MFGFLPAKLGEHFVGENESVLLKNFIVALLKVILLYLFILLLRFFAPINEIFRFNKAGYNLIFFECENLRKNLRKNKNILKKDDKKNKNKKSNLEIENVDFDRKNKNKKNKIKGEKCAKISSPNAKNKKKIKINKKINLNFKYFIFPNFLNFVVFVFLFYTFVLTLCGVNFEFWFNLLFCLHQI